RARLHDTGGADGARDRQPVRDSDPEMTAARSSAASGRPRRPATAGAALAGARVARVDAARSGRSRDLLPTGSLRTEWQLPLGVLVDEAPLVDATGTTDAGGTRGEGVAVGRGGDGRW